MKIYVDKLNDDILDGKDITTINFIINEDADIYTRDKVLLCKFRKKVLNKEKIKNFYENVIDFAKNITSNRGTTSGQFKKKKNVKDNPKVMTNVLGYMDGFSPKQKFNMKRQNIYPTIQARECRFNIENPDKWNNAYPLIKQIDSLYKKHLPSNYKKQRQKADETFYKIRNTAFTTVTTNVNFKTKVHKDKGDDEEGFGNLIVIEDGNYTGGETCFPQYGFGINVREGDILFMNTHEYHGNLPIVLENENVKRLSVVCYLRLNVWKFTKGIDKSILENNNKLVRQLGKKSSFNS